MKNGYYLQVVDKKGQFIDTFLTEDINKVRVLLLYELKNIKSDIQYIRVLIKKDDLQTEVIGNFEIKLLLYNYI